MARSFKSLPPWVECLKVFWMCFWRLQLVSLLFALDQGLFVFVLSLGLALLMVYGLKKSLGSWPIVRSFRGRRIVYPLPPFKGSYVPGPRSSAPPIPSLPLLEKATRPGRKTGFEPHILEPLKLQKSPWIMGDPGSGLHQSSFDKTSIKLGQAGEVNFAKALQKAGLIDRFQSYWSVAFPDKSDFVTSRTYNSDIDCILFNGKTLYLVDLKNYKGGDLTYYLDAQGTLRCQDNATQQPVRTSSKMSKNMGYALELYQHHLSSTPYRVEAKVVFMPTNMGEATLRGVRWPGGVEAVNLSAFLSELSKTSHFHQGDHSWLNRRLAAMVKR